VRIGVALHEAVRNAIQHGSLELPLELQQGEPDRLTREVERRRQSPPYATRRVRVVVRESPSEGSYVVADEGPGFDPSKLGDPSSGVNLQQPTGRGLFLIRTFMDEVSFRNRGREVCMVHRRR
jgi:anti-sigma regulatory factor (Ser/Thr protein kinase)